MSFLLQRCSKETLKRHQRHIVCQKFYLMIHNAFITCFLKLLPKEWRWAAQICVRQSDFAWQANRLAWPPASREAWEVKDTRVSFLPPCLEAIRDNAFNANKVLKHPGLKFPLKFLHYYQTQCFNITELSPEQPGSPSHGLRATHTPAGLWLLAASWGEQSGGCRAWPLTPRRLHTGCQASGCAMPCRDCKRQGDEFSCSPTSCCLWGGHISGQDFVLPYGYSARTHEASGDAFRCLSAIEREQEGSGFQTQLQLLPFHS